jgi:hypothetical protein
MDDGGLDDRTLRRIIALLVSFAAMAERAAGRSLPVRWLVLCILRYAETVALDYVAEQLQVDFSALDDEQSPGHGPYDAALLAWRLRTLASLLGTLLEPTLHPDDWTLDLESRTAGHDRVSSGLASLVSLFVLLAGREPAFQDTS